MSKRLSQREKNTRELDKMMTKTGKVLYTAVTGKKRRKKTKIEKIIDLFK